MTENKALQLCHQVLLLDAEIPHHLVGGEKLVSKFIEEMLRTLKMEPLGCLNFYMATDARAPGWSFLQPITTSHISGHYFEAPKLQIHLDIYSCLHFEWKEVLGLVFRDFLIGKWSGNLIYRDTNPSHRACYVLGGEGVNVTCFEEQNAPFH